MRWTAVNTSEHSKDLHGQCAEEPARVPVRVDGRHTLGVVPQHFGLVEVFQRLSNMSAARDSTIPHLAHVVCLQHVNDAEVVHGRQAVVVNAKHAALAMMLHAQQ